MIGYLSPKSIDLYSSSFRRNEKIFNDAERMYHYPLPTTHYPLPRVKLSEPQWPQDMPDNLHLCVRSEKASLALSKIKHMGI